MKTLSLNIFERSSAITLLREKTKNVPFDVVRMALRISDKLEIKTDEERALFGYKEVEGQARWDETKEQPVEFSDEQYDFLVKCVGEKDKEKNFSLGEGRGMVTLCAKILKEEI